ncbi:Cell division topological specificity factor [Buchnera aphidicola (Chaitophorus sp. 3695)]|uniref:cell division topological specificity factor MinE n=1 Tax=Buchnera aphidicola TaxID=9 RepID=UPI003464B6D8
MILLDFFLSKKKKSAFIAKKRLKIILDKENKTLNTQKYIPTLKKEILNLVQKHMNIDQKFIKIQLEYKKNNKSILGFNIILQK